MNSSATFDFLTTSPALKQICEYLEPNDALRCTRVNRNMFFTIKDNWMNMKRNPAKVTLISCVHDINAVMRAEEGAVTICCIFGKHPRQRQVFLEMEESYVLANGRCSHKFLQSLRQNQGSKWEPIKMRFKQEDYKLISESNTTLRDVLRCLLWKVELQSFELLDANNDPSRNTLFTHQQLVCIRDCLKETSVKVRSLPATTLHMNVYKNVHNEIIRAAGMSHVQIVAQPEICDTNIFVNIPANMRGYMVIEVDASCIDKLQGLHVMLQEWVRGRKQITRLYVLMTNDEKLFIDDEVGQIRSYLPEFEMHYEAKDVLLGRIHSDVDDDVISFSIKPGQYEFWDSSSY